jgi:hypothetical protein
MQYYFGIIEIVAEELSKKFKRTFENLINKGFSSSDFEYDEVEVRFNDGSIINLVSSFYIISKKKNILTIFTEHCGFHIFMLPMVIDIKRKQKRKALIDTTIKYCCERFKETVLEGMITHSYSKPDETEWFIPYSGHIYFCPFCGKFIKGDGWGNYKDYNDQID